MRYDQGARRCTSSSPVGGLHFLPLANAAGDAIRTNVSPLELAAFVAGFHPEQAKHISVDSVVVDGRSPDGGAMIAPARVAAYEILSAVSGGSADLPAAIAVARGGLRDDRDRALAAEIAAGVQRWRAALDHVIVAFAKRPLARLDTQVVEILRLSVYQLLHLTRVPASAVVDDAVNLARRAGKASATGFVNAVLREASRKRGALPLPPRPADAGSRAAALEYLSVTLSHPRWLASRWYDRLGFDVAEAWMQFNNTPGALTLRANRFAATRDELADRLRALEIETR